MSARRSALTQREVTTVHVTSSLKQILLTGENVQVKVFVVVIFLHFRFCDFNSVPI